MQPQTLAIERVHPHMNRVSSVTMGESRDMTYFTDTARHCATEAKLEHEHQTAWP